MTAPTSPRYVRNPVSVTGPRRDRFLDAIKAVAVVRVVLWHTWSWWWLSWIPAMPTMFFASGALLEDSLARRGWWATVRQRVRRLIVPFWVYSATSTIVMVALGWRPAVDELVGWVVPLVDPVGDPQLPGLWIPLWYIRAYLWFVLGAWVLSRIVRRFGAPVVAAAVAATFALWWWTRSGTDVPAEVGDAIAYSAFVMAGMRYRAEGAPSRLNALVLGVGGAAAALWLWSRTGPADGIVNSSYPLTVLVGMAGLGLALSFRDRLANLPGGAQRAVDLVGRRALTIYLWQGPGLVAAQRIVEPRVGPWPLKAVASLAVVVAVIVAAVVVVGPVEDLAAGRGAIRHGAIRRGAVARRLRPGLAMSAIALPGVAVMVVALLVPTPDGPVEAPLSGKAVVTRAEQIQRSLEEPDPTAPSGPVTDPNLPASDRLAAAVDDWVAQNDDLFERIDLGRMEGAVVTATGEHFDLSWAEGSHTTVRPAASQAAGDDEQIAWWSITKAATAAWLLRSVEAGKINLDDQLGRWVPEAPNATSMTIEQLARHMSGIPTELDGDFMTTAPDVALTDYHDRSELAFEPGEGFAYSRTGYFLLTLALERATGVPWRVAMEDLAERAGVRLTFDEDTNPLDRVTDPDGHGYRGSLWASGGVLPTVGDGAGFFQWAFTEGLDESSRVAMTEFSADPERWFYGIGLMPLCPCETEGDRLLASRFGLDSAIAFVVHDEESTATVLIAPDSWFDDDGPAPEFYELQGALLDAAA